MSPVVLGALVTAAALAPFVAYRPRAVRPVGVQVAHERARRDPLAAVVGRLVLHARRSPRASDRSAATWTGRSVIAGVLLLPTAGPAAAALAVVTCAAVPGLAARRARAGHQAMLAASLPEAVDLLALAIGAGMTVRLAVAAVSRRAEGPVAAALGEAVAAAGSGQRLADALDALPARHGELLRPLTGALAASERYGAPLAPTLERIASEVRIGERRRAEEAARRVPVRLLFPLVVCILPAFALLTVAPLLASGLRSLRL